MALKVTSVTVVEFSSGVGAETSELGNLSFQGCLRVSNRSVLKESGCLQLKRHKEGLTDGKFADECSWIVQRER